MPLGDAVLGRRVLAPALPAAGQRDGVQLALCAEGIDEAVGHHRHRSRPFVDPEVARVVIPAMTEFNQRSRAVANEAEREQLRKEIYSRFEMPQKLAPKVADHIEYVRRVAGIRHVGIGSDFDGSVFFADDLADTSMFPNVFAELIRRGWTDRELTMLAGENLLRVLETAESVATQLQHTTPASVARIDGPKN